MANTATHWLSGSALASVSLYACGASWSLPTAGIVLWAAYKAGEPDTIMWWDSAKLMWKYWREGKDEWWKARDWGRYTQLHNPTDPTCASNVFHREHRLVDSLGFHKYPGKPWFKRLWWLDFGLLLLFAAITVLFLGLMGLGVAEEAIKILIRTMT